MEKRFTISITAGTVITTLVILASAFALWTLRDLALLVLTAIVIASAIEPGVAFFARRHIPRVLSVLLMYLLVFGTVFGFVYFFLPPIIDDAQQFLISVPHYLDTIQLPQQFSSVSQATGLLSSSAATGSNDLLTSLLSVRQTFTSTSEGTVRLFITFFGGLFSFFLVVVLSFYFAIQNTGVEDFLRLITPEKQEEYVADLWRRAQKKIGLWMQGQILLSVIVGVLVYLGMLIMGIPYALLLAIFTSLAEIIPIFGSLIAGGLATAVAFSTGGIALAFIVAGLFIVVNQFETNLIYPLVVKKVIGLPPLLVIIALIAGGQLAGFLGVLLSVPLAAAAQEFFADLDKGKRGLI
ncbi:MAG: AI-2E family transporter [Patescibacteria group bacterium]|nr:AI-2E family transporter [Patescibacteria group bacterium]MDE1966245.1 AI-2E family transporter [Patescibacteria group bacterium]